MSSFCRRRICLRVGASVSASVSADGNADESGNVSANVSVNVRSGASSRPRPCAHTLNTVAHTLGTVAHTLSTVARTLSTVARTLGTVARTLGTVARTLGTVAHARNELASACSNIQVLFQVMKRNCGADIHVATFGKKNSAMGYTYGTMMAMSALMSTEPSTTGTHTLASLDEDNEFCRCVKSI
jgi:hypothetical protein